MTTPRPVSQPAERERLAALIRDLEGEDILESDELAARLIAAGVRLSGDDEGLRALAAEITKDWNGRRYDACDDVHEERPE